MLLLKQNTASQELPLGPFLDSTDGNSEETALTIANTDIKIWKNGATTLANKNSGGATHISNGIYYVVLDATDTNTLGPMVIFVHVAGALVVRLEALVVTAAAYDVWTAITGDPFARLGAPAGASISADISAVNTKTAALPSDPADASDIAGAFATVNSTLGTIAGYIDTEVAAIKAKTDNLPAAPAAVGDIPTAAQIADAVLDDSIPEPSSVFAWPATGRSILGLLGALSRNKKTQSATTFAVRNDADTANIASSSVSDDSTTLIKGALS